MQERKGFPPNEKLKVLLIDSLPFFLAGLASELKKSFDVQIANPEVALQSFDHAPKVVLVGLTHDNFDNMLELIKTLDRSNTRVIAIISNSCKGKLGKLIQLDIEGYVCRSIPVEVLIRAVNLISGGENFIDKQIAPFLLNIVKTKELYKNLTEREIEVLNLFLNGLPAKAIARELHISERTVRFHLRNIYSKFGVARKQELCQLLNSFFKLN